jgi:hypothetical protein
MDELKLPPWFPKGSPWPKNIWTMTTEEYVKAIPDGHLRTQISGYLMRKGYELALRDVFSCLCREIADNPEINREAAAKLLDMPLEDV